MTPAQRVEIRNVLHNVRASGIASGEGSGLEYHKYTPDMALAEIERILEGVKD